MSSPDLILYEYGRKPSNLVGTKILVDSTTQEFTVSDGTSQVVLGAFDASGLSGAAYGYQTDYPLMLKLFCYDVVPDSTGRFDISVSGKLGDATSYRRGDEDFGMTWEKDNWDALGEADATVSIRKYPPVTSVTLKCVCGIATDYIDRKSEGSYR